MQRPVRPQTGVTAPEGWDREFYDYVMSLRLKGDMKYILVKQDSNGTSVSLNLQALLDSISIPTSGGGKGGATEVNEVTSDVIIQPSTDGTKLTLVYPRYKVSASQSQTAFDGFNVYATVTYWDDDRERYNTVTKRFIKNPTVVSGWTPRGQYGFISFQGRLLRTYETLQLAFALVDAGGDKKGLQVPTSPAGAASVFDRKLAYYEVVNGIVSVTQLHYGVMAPVTLVTADGAVADLPSIIAYGGDSIIATN